MTPLERLIRAQIAADGPMTVAAFMELALGHPRHGYYATRDPLGRGGDFTTAPEISQMFGEIVGLWLSAVWQAQGRPPARLVELGPGRGTLTADARRAAPALGALELWLVETSPVLRAEQARRLPDARWAAAVSEVPEGPLLLVANEFLDALPVRQWIASPEGWRERLVGLLDGRLGFGLSPPLPGPAPEGAWVERSSAAEEAMAEISRRVASYGGAALVIDYGYAAERPPGPTLQALRAQAPADPLEAPGEADLTWLIDFRALVAGARPCQAIETEQGAFLGRLGIGHRAAALAGAAPDRAGEIAEALERLTAPDRMGKLFRACAVLPPGSPLPPGFEESP